jgi:hypothetical protein
MWRISRSNSIIKWQGYRVSASRLAESNFRYTQELRPQRSPTAVGPGKSDDARTAAAAPKAAGEPAAAESEAFTPPPSSPRLDTALRRPLKTEPDWPSATCANGHSPRPPTATSLSMRSKSDSA